MSWKRRSIITSFTASYKAEFTELNKSSQADISPTSWKLKIFFLGTFLNNLKRKLNHTWYTFKGSQKENIELLANVLHWRVLNEMEL